MERKQRAAGCGLLPESGAGGVGSKTLRSFEGMGESDAALRGRRETWVRLRALYGRGRPSIHALPSQFQNSASQRFLHKIRLTREAVSVRMRHS